MNKYVESIIGFQRSLNMIERRLIVKKWPVEIGEVNYSDVNIISNNQQLQVYDQKSYFCIYICMKWTVVYK